MGNVAITYFSWHGQTRKLADEIAVALGQEGCAARLIDVTDLSDTDWQAMEAAEAILFGAPTYMGGVAGEFKSFMDATRDIWQKQLWADKLAGGFTVMTPPDEDRLSSLMQLNLFAMRHGMVWVGQDQVKAAGTWPGLALSTTEQIDLDAAHQFGFRIARAVRRWAI